jgi:RNA polymerase sigma factor (sigma-70 family)
MIAAAVKRYVKPGSDEESDIVQDVFISLFKALKDYDPNRSLEAYILEITRRVRISRYRKDSALKRGGANPAPLPLDAHDSGGDCEYVSVAAGTDDQEAALIRAQESSLLRQALRSLSDQCRKLLR